MSRALAALLFALALASQAHATPESICPGGASPRSDIDWCVNFDQYNDASCVTGQESACVTANGLDDIGVNNSDDFKIKDCSTSGDGPAPIGVGCIYGSGKAGSTGPGYSDKASSTSSTSAAYRYMVRFGKGYLPATTGQANHFPGIKYGATGSDCNGLVTGDPVSSGATWLVEVNNASGCANVPSSFSLATNIDTTWRPKNNRWYTFEIDVAMNTAGGTTGPGVHQGDGIFKAYVDDVLVASYTDINFRGTNTAPQFRGVYGPRAYYGSIVPSWKPNVAFANLAYSKNGTHIGVPSGTTLGTADTFAYFASCNYGAYAQHRPQLDCSTSGYDGQCVQSGSWRTAPTWQSSIVNNSYAIDSTSSNCTGHTNQAMLSSVTGSGGSGISEPPASPVENTRIVVHTHTYLPSTNAPTANLVLSGFARYGSSSNWDHYAAICQLTNGNLGVCYNNSGTKVATDTGVAWTSNVMHEEELDIDSSNKVYLYFDGTWVLNGTTAAQTAWSWLSDAVSAGPLNIVTGILDYTGTGTVNAYDDDSDSGSSSYVGCGGWSTDSCPFASPTPTPSPSPTASPSPSPSPTPNPSPGVSSLGSPASISTPYFPGWN